MNDTSVVTAEELILLASDIVSACLGHNKIEVGDVPGLITAVHGALASLGQETAQETPPEPAVSVRASVKRDHLVCLEDGKKVKMLRRHLMTEHGLTPEDYRSRWGLAADYPMVAPEYAERRRDLAVKIGLGRIPGQKRGRQNNA